MIRSDIKLHTVNTFCALGSLIKIFNTQPHTTLFKIDFSEITFDFSLCNLCVQDRTFLPQYTHVRKHYSDKNRPSIFVSTAELIFSLCNSSLKQLMVILLCLRHPIPSSLQVATFP